LELNRRDFLKLSSVAIGSIPILDALEVEKLFATSPGISMKKRVGEKSSICAFCAGGCGILVGVEGDKITSTEGDPDHPINQGALCSKAQALSQIRTVSGQANPYRLTPVLYRAPNSLEWEEKTWDWVLDKIATRVKQTRDENWIEKDEDGVLVNRTEAIAQVGGSAHDNEECYLISKMNRALGLVYTETQARI
jgi:formate dehydrogenase major subunit